MDPNLLQFITIGGAAAVAMYVIHLLATGRLHTHSEVEGLRADKADLWAANKELQEAVSGIIAMLGEHDK